MSRTVVITGAGGGLGSIFAKEFAKTGYRVAILDFNIQAGQKVACEIEQAGGDAAAFQVDVTDKASLEKARDAVVQHFGSYEVLINCAGIQDPLAKTTSEAYAAGDEKATEVVKVDPQAADLAAEKARVLASSRTLFNIDSDKLLRVTLYDGTGTDRQILSGIHKFYEPEELVGKTLVAIVNLPPRKMMGIDSCGMLISAVHHVDGEERLNFLMVDDDIPAGAKLY